MIYIVASWLQAAIKIEASLCIHDPNHGDGKVYWKPWFSHERWGLLETMVFL